MAVFSKPLSISPSCYELGHCWNPNCYMASVDVAKNVFREALKIYGTLYLIAGIVQRKGLRYYINKFIPETLRSTVFLTINGTLFISMFCIWRRIVGCYIKYNVFLCGPPICMLSLLIEQKSRNTLDSVYFLTASFAPAFVAAFTAVLFERKSRRGPLAVYLTNLAVETGFRMLVERGIVKPIHNGEVYLFSAVSAIYLYLFKSNSLPRASNSLFQFFVGADENKNSVKSSSATTSSSSSTSSSSNNNSGRQSTNQPEAQYSDTRKNQTEKDIQATTSKTSSSQNAQEPSRKSTSIFSTGTLIASLRAFLDQLPFLTALKTEVLEQWKPFVTWLESLPRHKLCPHGHSCLSYVLKGGSRMFTLGYVVQAAISLVSSLPKVLRKPATLISVLVSKHNLKLAAFLGGYSSIFRAVNCVLRWIRNKDDKIHGAIAGAFAGLSLRFYRSVTITLYAATKLAEILYFKGIEAYGFPHIKCADIFIYAFSTAFIFHAAVMEPHTLRPGYWRFLNQVTDNKMAGMNRRLLDVFGVNSSKLMPDYWPKYDPRYTSIKPPAS